MNDYHIHSDFSDGDMSIEEIVSTAMRKKLDAIAITDHISSDGKFMYLRHTRPPLPLKTYMNKIKSVSKNTKLKIFIGVEISDFADTREPIAPEFSQMDLILVETQKPRGPTNPNFDPIARAKTIKDQFKNIPVGLAHPTIEFVEKNIEKFVNNDIFLELNGDKLSRNHTKLDSVFEKLKTLIMDNKELRISIGSDAHQIFMIGSVKPIWDFIQTNDFLDRIILY
jgi:histidinol phosphatase-like PHP family hydrolase